MQVLKMLDLDDMTEEQAEQELARLRNLRMQKQQYPAFPSARITVPADCFEAAMEVVEGLPQVFTNGRSILVPESERGAIEWLRTQFGGTIEWGCCEEYAYANRARAAGVSPLLVSLGQMVTDVTGKSIEEMIRAALDAPEHTQREWAELYRADMLSH